MSADNIQNIYPLSPLQEGMLVHYLMDRTDPAYFEQSILKIQGVLDSQCAEKSMNILIDRHEILRTAFVFEEIQRPMQIVLKHRPVIMSKDDISSFPADQQKEQMDQWLAEDRKNLFNLTQDPLIRFSIIKGGNGCFHLVWSYHHILMDGWCLPILLQEFIAIYYSCKKDQVLQLDMAMPYCNYIQWIEGKDKEIAKAYWSRYLADYNELTGLPKIRKINRLNVRADQEYHFSIPKKESALLMELGEKCGGTLNTLMQVIWAILLHRYNNTDDVAFDIVVSGRSMPIEKIDRMIGLFINTLPIRFRFAKGLSFIKCVENTQEGIFASDQHSFLNLSEVHGSSQIKNNLIDHLFVFENYPMREIVKKKFYPEDLGFDITSVELVEKTSYPLTVIVLPGDDIIFKIQYDSMLYDREIFVRLETHLQAIVKAVIDRPEIEIDHIELLLEREKNQILIEFNQSEQPIPAEKLIHELLEERAQTDFSHAAVICEDFHLTYGQLNSKANQLAHYLRRHGVGPGEIVAVRMERSIEMLISLFGILKSGGAYLPIDPRCPSKRLSYMLKDATVKILITDSDLINDILFDGKVVSLNEDALYQENKENLERINSSSDLAYVMYTSGSTGDPKGVMIEHRSVVNNLFWMQRHYPLQKKDVILQKTPFTFDVSIPELFWWPISGAAVFILSPQGEKDPLALLKTVKNHQVSIIHFVPSLFRAFLDYLENSDDKDLLLSIRQIFLSGEAIHPEEIRRHYRLFGEAIKIANLYGPTEGTVHVSYYDCSEKNLERIPIGKAVDNMKLYVLGLRNQLQPIGIPGELCFSGLGVARGYLNKDVLTSQRFVQDPFCEESKMYRTGDLSRWLPNGQLEYLGRLDHQVKIRGFRVELEEIESCLKKYPGIKDAVVFFKEDKKGIKSLYGCYVAEHKIEPIEIRRHLLNLLPDYMLPANFQHYEKFPLTTSGKIDRKQLENTIFTGLEASAAFDHYHPPQNPLEHLLSEIWNEVLPHQRRVFGINEDFFSLGGDSIKAIQIISRLKARGIQLSVRDFFEFPTIALLTKQAKQVQRKPSQIAIEGEIRLTPIQAWFFQNHLIRPHHFNQSLMLHSCTKLNEAAVLEVITKLVEHHDILRSIFHNDNGYIRQVNRSIRQAKNSFTFDSFKLDGDANKMNTMASIANRLQATLDIFHGPLMKVAVFETFEDEGSYLLLIIHHLLVDTVSWRILFEDLARGFQQHMQGKEITFAEKTTSFQKWSAFLHQYRNCFLLKNQKTYWEKLEAVSSQPFPKDDLCSCNTYEQSTIASMSISEQMIRQLIQESYRVYRLEFRDVLLISLGLALQDWSKLKAILIDVEGHGREALDEDVDLSRTVGWFTSIYPVLFEFHEESDLSSQLKCFKEQLRKIPKNGLGYGVLKYLEGKDKNAFLNNTANANVLFNYLGELTGIADLERSFLVVEIEEIKTVAPSMRRLWDFEVAVQMNHALIISLSYNKEEYESKTIQALLQNFRSWLFRILEHCTNRVEKVCTPSDFGCASLSIEEFEGIIHDFSLATSEIVKIYPLSPMQEGMLFHYLLNSSDFAYFEQTVFKIEGNLYIEIFREAFNILIENNEILRTRFFHRKLTKPMQVVLSQRPASIIFEDLTTLRDAEKKKLLDEKVLKDRQAGFNLSQEPLIRVLIIKLAENDFRVICSHHHILIDGWCLSILFSDLLQVYYALKHSTSIELRPRKPYSYFIDWLQKQNQEEAEDYWTKYLKGYSLPLQLPQISKKHDSPEFAVHKTFGFTIDSVLVGELIKLTSVYRVTLNTLLQGIWAVMLHHYTGSEDIVFGAVVSGRPHEIEDVERMVGLFINTIPVRVRLTKSRKFIHCVKNMQAQALESEKFAYLPLNVIQSRSNVKQQLVTHLWTFENYPVEKRIEELSSRESLGFEISDCEVFDQTNYDFNILVFNEKELKFCIKYHSQIYDDRWISEIAVHFEQVIQEVIENPQINIQDIAILPSAKKIRWVDQFNSTDRALPDMPVHALFEDQVKKFPKRIAATFEGMEISYEQLNQRANNLAQKLLNLGAKPNDIIGVMAGRSIELIATLLAILKLGAAYLPLDPAYPLDRLRFMIGESGVEFIVADEKSHPIASSLACAVDPFADECHHAVPAIPPKKNNEPSNEAKAYSPWEGSFQHSGKLAYVIYTSGSTGKPKGVMVSHKSLVNYICWAKEKYLNEKQEGNCALCTSISFDLTITSIFLPLVSGSQIRIYPEDIVFSNLEKIFQDPSVHILKVTPSHLKMLEAIDCEYSRLRCLIVGGERFPSDLARKIHKKFQGRIKIFNEYGPTEATVGCMVSLYQPDCQLGSVPLGEPCDNTQIYILSPSHHHVPELIPGELYIGGSCLAEGYVDRPDLTKKFFIKDPFNHDRVVYKTGDLVRRTPEGEIEYLGRTDHQVKIRGFRIEVEEIESILNQHPAVRQSIVLVNSRLEGESELVACVESHLDKNIRETALDEDKQIENWNRLYEDHVYKSFENIEDSFFNISGWSSSYTGKPLPAEEMREWLDETVQTILSLKPKKVFEIGCGTGLILFNVAGHCVKYMATDFSNAALNYIKSHLSSLDNSECIFLSQQRADVPPQVPLESFDTIILNSVIQYFPSIEYLQNVIEKSLDFVEDGGRIFIGDVRSLPLLEAFHTSVELHRAPSTLHIHELTKKIRKKIKEEVELVVHPAFFRSLEGSLARVAQVEIIPKKGKYNNELNAFRYQVVIHVGKVKKNQINAALLQKEVLNDRALEALALIELLKEHQDQRVQDIRKLKIDTAEVSLNDMEAQVIEMSNVPIYRMREKKLIDELRGLIKQKLPSYMSPVSLVIVDKFPLSANGKVDREALLKNDYCVEKTKNNFTLPRDEREAILTEIWRDILSQEKISIHDNFFELGGDSIKAIQIVSKLQNFNLNLKMKKIFECPTIAALAPHLSHEKTLHDQGEITGKVALSPIQCWFFSVYFETRNHFSQTILLSSRTKLNETAIKKSLEALILHHDALRMTYTMDKEGISQWNSSFKREDSYQFWSVDFTEEEKAEEKITLFASKVQESFNLETGPLIKSVLFNCSEGDFLLFVIHHLVVDGISWRIFLEDFSAAYQDINHCRQINLPPKTDSYQQWAEAIVNDDHPVHPSIIDYWKQKHNDSLHLQTVIKPCKRDESKSCRLELSEQVTARFLKESHWAYLTEANDLLLTALSLALTQFRDSYQHLVLLEGHGREQLSDVIDTTRTIGWFTSIFPVILALNPISVQSVIGDVSIGLSIKHIKELLRSIPNKGVDYGRLKYCSTNEIKKIFEKDVYPELSFNYLGQFDDHQLGLFDYSSISCGPNVSPDGLKIIPLEMNIAIVNQRMQIQLEYNALEYNSQNAERFLHLYKEWLLQVIDHCTSQTEAEKTPSDFGDGELSLNELGVIQSALKSSSADFEKILPLSPMQEGILFHSVLTPESSAYHEQSIFTIEGSFDVSIFRKSIESLIARHEILRTVFVYNKLRSPRQVVLKEGRFDFSYEDISVSRAQLIEQDRSRGFDLVRGPLFRVSVFQRAPAVYLVIWSYHHILMDGWSSNLLFNELLTTYKSLSGSNKIQLNDVPPYSYFIQWLKKGAQQNSRPYWQNYLQGYDRLAELPKKPNITPLLKDDYREIGFSLGEELTKHLEQLASNQGVTLSTLFQAIWSLLLQRYNDTDDVVFGCVVSGRIAQLKQMDEMVGLFINTVPIRFCFNGDVSFREALSELQRIALEAEEHIHCPLKDIQAASQLKQQLFNHILVFENYPFMKEMQSLADIMELDFKVVEGEVFSRTNYDFNVLVFPGNCLEIKFKFNSNVYEEQWVRKIEGHLNEAISQILLNPDSPLNEIEILAKEELVQLAALNDTSFEIPPKLLIHHLFEEQVLLNPQSIALSEGSQQLSYFQLNQKANQLGHHLQKMGVGLGTSVGIYLNRSLESIIAILAVLKTGGLYLPLDVSFPSERVSFILKDSSTHFLITDSKVCKERLVKNQIDIHSQLSDNEPTENLNLDFPSEHSAYIIYTSGSTGRPKGVIISHRSVVNYAFWGKSNYLRRQNHVFPLFTSLAFDLSATALYLSLLMGHHLIVFPEKSNKLLIEEVFNDPRVDIIKLTPSHLKMIRDIDVQKGDFRTLIVGGELLPSELANETIQKFDGNVQIYNHYGPTETTIGCFTHLFESSIGEANVPIGSAAYNTRAYIVDRRMKLVPVGVPGQLCISGMGLAKGYLNRPDLTRDKFISFEMDPQGISYLTGDIAVWGLNGKANFLGRKDFQIKIKGYRVEPEEISRVLKEHDAVKDAAVITVKGGNNENTIYAFVIARCTLELLSSFLASRLPVYMMPESIISLDELPLTKHGKLDREKLAKIAEHYRKNEYNSQKISSETNAHHKILPIIKQVWQEILRKPSSEISLNDNFFALGGDSIKALQIVGLLQNYNLRLNLRDVFSHPILEDVVNSIEVHESKINDREEVASEVKMSPIQMRFFEQSLFQCKHYNQAVMLFSEHSFDSKIVFNAFEKLVGHHDALRIVFSFSAQGIVQRRRGIDEGKLFDYKVFDFRYRKNSSDLIQVETDLLQRSFNLSKGPLVSIGLFQTTEGDHLLIIIHHLVVDAVSWRILLEDFSTLLQQALLSKEMKIVQKTASYQRWTEQLHELARETRLKDQLPYWEKNTSDDVKSLPKEMAGTSNYVSDTSVLSFRLDQDQTAYLSRLSEQSFSLQEILLTSLLIALRDWTHEEVFLVDLEGHGRDTALVDLDLSRTIGWFTAVYPVLFELEKDSTAKENIEKIKETLQKIPQQGLGYGLLKYLSEDNNALQLKKNTESEILFNYLGHFDNQIHTNQFHLSSLSVGNTQSPERLRRYQLEIKSMVIGGELEFSLIYNKNQYFPNTMKKLLGACKQHILEFIDQILPVRLTSSINVSSSWNTISAELIVPLNPTGTKKPLFIVHPADGLVTSYSRLLAHWDSDRPLYGIQARGLEGDKKPHHLVEKMAREYINSIITIQPKGPYLLSGWSFGGTVAFEMAHQVLANREEVAFLGLLDENPLRKFEYQEYSDSELLIQFALQKGLDFSFHQKETVTLLELLDHLKNNQSAPKEASLEQVRVLLEIFRANGRAAKSYQPQSLPIPITLFKAIDSETIPSEFLNDVQQLSSHPLIVHHVAGSHITMIQEPHVGELTKKLIESIKHY